MSLGVGLNARRVLPINLPAAPIYAPSTYVYESNFAAVPNGTLLRNVAGWGAINRDGLVLASRDDVTIENPGARTNYDGFNDPIRIPSWLRPTT